MRKFTIEEINEFDVKRICKDNKFSRLRPVSCCRCGNEKSFARKLFKVMGVPKSKRSDDEVQIPLERYFKSSLNIEHVFFKIVKDEFIADSAICNSCKSTAITYDIELTGDILSEIEKFMGKSNTNSTDSAE